MLGFLYQRAPGADFVPYYSFRRSTSTAAIAAGADDRVLSPNVVSFSPIMETELECGIALRNVRLQIFFMVFTGTADRLGEKLTSDSGSPFPSSTTPLGHYL